MRFPDGWIGRGGPIPWPPRSPLEFFLWGYIKNIVYAEKIRIIQHLQEMITSPIEINTTHDSENVAGDLDVYRATNGAYWTLIKKGSSNIIENPFLVSFIARTSKNLQVVIQVKSPSCSCFVFVFPLSPILTDGRTARYSFLKTHEVSFHPPADPNASS